MTTMKLTRFFAAGLMGLWLTACGQTGNPLAGDYNANSKCPPNGCAGLDPDPNQLSISNMGKASFNLPPQVDKTTGLITDQVEISGDCYPSSYPSNRIEVKVLNNGQEVLIGDYVSTRTSSYTTTARCINGRYGFAINGARMPGGNVYKVSMRLIGITSTGAEVSTSGSNQFAVSVIR